MVSIEKIKYYKPHWHDEMLEFAMVLEGSVDTVIGGESYRMSNGKILLIGTGEVHSFRETDEENIVLFLRFDCRLLEKEFPGIMNWNLIRNPSADESEKNDLDHLRTLMAETVLSNSVCGGADDAAVLKLLKYCRDKFLSAGLLRQKQDLTRSQLETFRELSGYIQRNYPKPVTLGEVAEYINYSFNHTSFIIKQITGMNFTDYLHHIRCLAAERMLISTDRNITGIAIDCGFTDEQAMDGYFRNRYRLSPGEYRQRVEESFPDSGLASFDAIDPNNPENLRKVECFIKSETRMIIFDFNSLPHGTAFAPPSLGQPEQHLDFDGCEAVPEMIDGILEGRIRVIKQTDDPGTSVFHGDCGLSTHRGIKKPVFYIFDFLSGIRSVIFKEDGIAAGLTKDGLRIILYPPPGSPEETMNEAVRFIFNSGDDDYIIKHFIVDCGHGNPKRMWEKVGSPAELTPDLEELFMNHSVPELSLASAKNRSSFELTERLPPVGAVMIEICRIEPV